MYDVTIVPECYTRIRKVLKILGGKAKANTLQGAKFVYTLKDNN